MEKITAGSWGKKPLQTDDTATDFDMTYERFEKLLVWAERKAIRALSRPNDNDFNLYPSGVGYVVWMMQHNAIMSTALKQAVLNWVKLTVKNPDITKSFKNEVVKFALAVRKYKPFIRKDLGVSLDAMMDQMNDERSESVDLTERPGYKPYKGQAKVMDAQTGGTHQELARLKSTEVAAKVDERKKAIKSALGTALRNIKKSTKASSGGLLKMQNDTKAYYGKLYKLYKKVDDAVSMTQLNQIVKEVKAHRAKRREHVKTARKPK